MYKILLMEIKDTKVLVTFTGLTNDNWSILLSKEYKYEHDSNKRFNPQDLTSFDISWIPKMKEDIEKIFAFNMIKNIFVVINTSGSLIETTKVTVNSSSQIKNAYIEEVEKKIKNYPKLMLLNHNLESIIETPLKKTLIISYEFINKEFANNIKEHLKVSNIKITDFISSKDAINFGLEKEITNETNISNIQIEDKFTAFHFINNGKFLNSVKKNQGLNYVYRKISEYAGISVMDAKDLFLKYGNIPPAAVKDNRIIYNDINLRGERKIFSKKDLSEVITNAINQILGEVIDIIKNNNMTNHKIIFSGEITKLKGFEAYSKSILNVDIAVNFKTDLVGLNSKSEIISVGALKCLATRDLKSDLIDLESGAFEKIHVKKGILQIFLDKVVKYYDYI